MHYDEYDEYDDNMKEDKILNNKYNTGDIEYSSFTHSIKIDNKVERQYMESLTENIMGMRTQQMLETQIYEKFKDSEFFEKYRVQKKVDKCDRVKMYYFFKKELVTENTYSNIEIFIGFAEFFQINYDLLYTEIGVRDKEEILRELQDGYNIKNKIKTKKLF